MIRSLILLSSFALFSTAQAGSENCAYNNLACSLEKQDITATWEVVAEGSTQYTSEPSFCMARVAIQSPVDAAIIYRAAASNNGDIFLFSTVDGKPNALLAASGSGVQAPVVLVDKQIRLSCQVK